MRHDDDLIMIDGITSEEVLLLGQRLRRPERIGVTTWRRFWAGEECRNICVVRSACEPFAGLVVARPHHVLVPDWFAFWQRRASNDLRVHA